MSKDFLLEIGTEEIPARFVYQASEQLKEKLKNWFDEYSIPYEDIKTYSTPRRLTVMVKQLAEKQEDRVEEARGPSIKIAKDDQGNWSKAAQGFARGQNISLDDVFVKEVKGVEYIFAKKEHQGQRVEEIIPAALEEIIKSMTFPKNMRWGNQEIRYVRPIKWLVSLFGNDLIPFEIAGVNSDRITRGHRFLGKEITLLNSDSYQSLLKEQFVIVDPEQRKSIILEQMKKLEEKNNWNIPLDDELLDEVVNLVEYPTVLYGGFKEEYLELPKEVLVTTMKEHQRYFPVEDKENNLLPNFVTVRNGDDRFLDVVSRGNEKVLTARLADARFFYKEDQRVEISDALSKLENIVFQEELGTLGDKVRRIKEVSHSIAEQLKIDEKTISYIDRTSEICKFDLVTNMVYEFPELQGLMGEKYARIHGEPEVVAKGISEHYLPKFAKDDLPESVVGQIISITDKLDNIVGSFTLGKVPTGSQDPLGLRRQAQGVVQILLEKLEALDLDYLFDLALASYEKRGLLKRSKEEILVDLFDFFTLRIKNLLQEIGIRYDIIDSVLETNKTNVKSIVIKANILMKELQDPSFKQIVDSFTRVINIAVKASNPETDPVKYQEMEETILYNKYEEVKALIEKLDDSKEILNHMVTLKQPIDAYFDKVMVMAENDDLRHQRLGLMLLISNMIQGYTDFTKIVFA